MKRPAFALILIVASAAAAQTPAKSAAMTPSFKSAAEVALDAIDSARSSDRGPELVYALQLAKARDELNRAKREVRTNADAIVAVKLLRYFNAVDLCHLERQAGQSSECDQNERYQDAVAAIGAKTWKTINAMSER